MTSQVATADALARPVRAAERPEAFRATIAEWVVGAFFFALCTVRYFTEKVIVLPRTLQFFDFAFVPAAVFVTLMLIVLRRKSVVRQSGLAFACLALGLVCAVSAFLNAADVYAPAAVLFYAGHAAPIAFAFAMANWNLSPRFLRRLVGIFAAFSVLEIVVGLTEAKDYIQQFSNSTESDAFSGTFGVNSDQLAILLAVVALLLLERQLSRSASFLERLLLFVTVAAMYVASLKVLWFCFPAIALAMVVLFGDRRVLRRIMYLTVIVAGAVVTIVYLGHSWYWTFRVLTNFDVVRRQPKVEAIMQIPVVLEERPWARLIGVGPGTFSSRGFRTFTSLHDELASNDPGDMTNVTAGIVTADYLPPLAAKYVSPLMPNRIRGYGEFGSIKTGGPFSSYPSVFVETGLIGGGIIFGLYFGVLWQLRRVYRRARRVADKDLRAVCFGAAGGLLLLLAMSVFDNFLEVTRVTIPIWMLVSAALSHASRFGIGFKTS